ncbi:MAG: putative glycolipid-binding domain-containing protein [Alphaproteobacteria bacterium]|nr:putative glycolipid-binding domain-containing protein [Alphaproteobacteria bacterium]MCW5742284.1 putative glycolipid-binding domain-containing protein [Alphaproteobacteria bacterium]
MTAIITARWRDWSGESLQHLVLSEGPDAIVAEAVVVGAEEGARFGARFRITCDVDWRTRRVEVDMAGTARRLDLHGDGAGHWRDGGGRSLPELDGAIDVDLPLTPFTNTLPIRRLNLGAGQSADLRMVYIVLPGFTVTVDPQRYICLEPLRRYRYESLDSDFVREIEVDSDGLVMVYPDLYRRIS